MKPGGGLVAESPRPGGGGGMAEEAGAGAEVFIGKEDLKEDLKPERTTHCEQQLHSGAESNSCTMWRNSLEAIRHTPGEMYRTN